MSKLALLGISWFRSAEDYAALREVFADPERLPVSYSDWLARAEEMQREVEVKGYTVLRVDLDPVAFPLWCEARELHIDAKARSRFASEAAMRRFERKDG